MFKIKKAVIYSDSELAVDGISGKRKIKAKNLVPMLERIKDIHPKGYDIVWVPVSKQLAHIK
jgi:hypothetical protein